jgi:hypothetical protein
MSEHRAEGTDDTDDATLVARVAPTLREPVTLGSAFESRVMDAVRRERQSGTRRGSEGRWWTRRRPFALSPLGGFALAASFAGIVAMGTLATTRAYPGVAIAGGGASAAHDTLHLVRLVYVDSTASSVAVAGDFNGWSRTATQLERRGPAGVWAVSLPVRPGRYEYAFIVNSSRWAPDPLADHRADEFGAGASVMTVGGLER